jgi:tRNA threonylcarbamoyladenosine modification (KEOPS) complex Cgi121 subunit
LPKVLCAEVRLPDPASADKELRNLREENPGLVIQLLAMKKRPNTRAVEMVAAQTLRARETGAMIAAKPEVDLLLRLAGTAQISQAIEKSGYKAEGRRFLVAAGLDEGIDRLEKSLSGGARADRYSLLPEDELDADGAAMVERAALLGTRN